MPSTLDKIAVKAEIQDNSEAIRIYSRSTVPRRGGISIYHQKALSCTSETSE